MGSSREQLLFLFSTPLYLIVIGLELLLSHVRHQRSYSLKDTFQNIYLTLLNAGVDLLFRAIYIGIILAFFYTYHIAGPVRPAWLYWTILLLSEDLMHYWLHRVDHVCRLFRATQSHITLLPGST